MTHYCRRLEFVNKCPYIHDKNKNRYYEHCGQTVSRAPDYECRSVPCHYAIEVLLRLLVKSKE